GIKVRASLDVPEKRLPQDGRILLRLGGRPIDVRVSTLPTGHGERVVLRLPDKERGRLGAARLCLLPAGLQNLERVRFGMSPEVLQTFDRLVKQPHGIVLVTGPTGSGKSTTLYAMLSRLEA